MLTKGLSVVGGEDVKISGVVVIRVDVVGADVAAVMLVVLAVVGEVVIVGVVVLAVAVVGTIVVGAVVVLLDRVTNMYGVGVGDSIMPAENE